MGAWGMTPFDSDAMGKLLEHYRACGVCRAFDAPGGADRSRDGLPSCRTYRKLHAQAVPRSA